MTRDFKKQRRDDSRPPFRNSPSNYNRDERPSRAPRPRLNREIVDRAWESGAQQQHADYHPRTNNRASGQYGQSPRRPYNGNTPQRNNTPSTRSHYSYGERNGNERGPYNSYERRQDAYSESRGPHNTNDGNRRNGYRENYNGSSSRRPYQDKDKRSSNNGNNHYANNGNKSSGQDFKKRDDAYKREAHDGNHGYSQSRSYSGSRQSQQRNDHSRPYQRYESRESEQRHSRQQGHNAERPNSFKPRESSAQFEGDYEWFDDRQDRDERATRAPRSETRPFRGNPNTSNQRDKQRERHVTPLPDGRVLKGPRPVQRRNAQFWTDVSQETEGLVKHISPPEQSSPEEGDALSLAPSTEISEAIEDTSHTNSGDEGTPNEAELQPERVSEAASETPRRRTRAASAVVRKKKEKSGNSESNTSVPKPSQRGFKWPTT